MTVETPEQIETQVMSEIDKQHYDEIRQLEQTCYKLENEYESDNAKSKASKKRWEEAVCKLRMSIRRGPNPQKELGFKEDWREAAIENALDLTDAQLEKLSEAGVSTVEDFENLRAGNNNDYPRGLLDLKGVGEATIDNWEEQILDWLKDNQPEEGDDSEDDSQ